MKKKSLITIILLIINIGLIFFLVFNRIIIWKKFYRIDERFLGMEFHAYRYSISRFSVYLPYFFAVAFVLSFYVKSNRIIRYLLTITSIAGLILAWKAYDYFAPW